MSELIDSFTSAWQRSFDFEGRSRRPAYWWFTLANFIVSLGLILFSKISNIVPIQGSVNFPENLIFAKSLTAA